MSLTSSFDFCVLGAGLAGFGVAKNLLQAGASVCMIDTGEVASGASGTPLGLVNPATGRWGTKVWEAESCLEAIQTDLEEIQGKNPVQFYKQTGILRPAQTQKMAAKMKENTETSGWPEGWCEWLDEPQIREMNPDLHCVEGGIWLPLGLTVNVQTFLKAKADHLKSEGLQIFTNARYTLEKTDSGFEISIAGKENIHSRSVIHATGYQSHEQPFWDFLPIHQVKGQLAIFKSASPLSFDYAISALGYISSLSKQRFVVGSTYEHNFEDTDPDEAGLNYLKERMSKVYPALFNNVTLENQWAGVRASTPGRKPFVGAHPEIEDLYIFTGLGSKGLLYSAYLGDRLADFILNKKEIPPEVSVSRIL